MVLINDLDETRNFVFHKRMDNSGRLKMLKELRRPNMANETWKSHEQFGEWQAKVAPLLNFNSAYHRNFQELASKTLIRGLSSDMYVNLLSQLDSIVAQAITELEHDLTPKPDPKQVAVPILTEEHGVWWFFWHCKSATRLKFLGLLGTVFLLGLALGSNRFFMQLYNLVRSSTTPSTSQIVTTTNTPDK